MIRPQTNAFRRAICLDGLWRCKPDPGAVGEAGGWQAGLDDAVRIAVPGSWNEQLAEAGLMNFTGVVWYQTEFTPPRDLAGKRVTLYFGSADYEARVYLDGREVGRSGPPGLPFEIDITGALAPGVPRHCLVVKVTAQLPEHGPMQRVTLEDYQREGRLKDEYLPAVRFDFFPFGGLNRSVFLCVTPAGGFRSVRVRTGWRDGRGWIEVETDGGDGMRLQLDGKAISPGPLDGVEAWSPQRPKLYDLTLTSAAGDDEVRLRIGFRTLEVDGQRLLLNGAPITLKGFGKHEDTPIAGRGVNLPFLVKDFQLLKWCGANSVRTSHYPYDEAFLDLADEMGILVISEVFSVNLDFRRTDERDLAAHKESVTALLARDGHHACVVAWSLANEPGYLGEAEYTARSAPYWADLFAHARACDDTRPYTVANVQYAGLNDPAFGESDFLSVNRYFGWYTEPGQLDRAEARLAELLDALSASHGKPVFVSEFGADAVAGMHSTTDQMWTEDYQSDLIETYWRIIATHPACCGGHVWNFADFRTAQHGRRAVMNRKGVFTRERDPKRAAFTVRRLWAAD